VTDKYGRPMFNADDILRRAGLPLSRKAYRQVPPQDLRILVAALVEILNDARADLHLYGGRLGEYYELFVCELYSSGFRFDAVAERKMRAQLQRRVGELAELRGDVEGAVAFFELAIASWQDVGCRRALDRLRRLQQMQRDAGPIPELLDEKAPR
jgi:hypothetical protein